VSAEQPDFAAIGIDPPRHAALLVREAPVAIGANFIHRIGLLLHGLLHEQLLELQGGLTDVFLDKAQALFGMTLNLG
jgi:hypothetical protein